MNTKERRVITLPRLSWIMWVSGIVLVFLSATRPVPPMLGWIGWTLSIAGVLLSLADRFRSRLFPLRPDVPTHPLARLLPDASAIPAELYLRFQGSYTNAHAAQRRPNPADALQAFVHRGRVHSVGRHYWPRRGCHPSLQLADVAVWVIQYTSPAHAAMALDTPDPADLVRHRAYTWVAPPLADQAVQRELVFTSLNTCRPPDVLTGYEVQRQCATVVLSAEASAVQGTLPTDTLRAIALALVTDMQTRVLATPAVLPPPESSPPQ